MPKLFSSTLLAFFLLGITSCCWDSSHNGAKSFTNSEVDAFVADSTGELMMSALDSMFTVSQRDLIKIPYAEIDSTTAKHWIRTYDSLPFPIGHDSLVKRIWLRDDVLGKVVLKASTAKFFVALDTTGANRVLTLLLQLNVKGSSHFKYYDLSDPTTSLSKFSVDGSFCPPPYPCSSDSIWAFKTAD